MSTQQPRSSLFTKRRAAAAPQWPDPALSRRGLVLSGGAAITASAAGCSWFSTDPEADRSGGEKGLEAPMLAERVEAGDLPPVEERLPKEPLVVQVTESMGVYGGTWNSVVTGSADGPWLWRTINDGHLLERSRDWEEIRPNVASSFEENDDATEYTITLREGVKWSDGEPLTTKDVEFAYNDVALNTDLTQGIPPELAGTDGTPLELEIVDDYTFIVRFSGPKPLFRADMAAGVSGQRFTMYPRHYLEQFHVDYNENAEQEALDAGYDGWVARFTALGNLWSFLWENPDLPTLLPWVCKQPISDAQFALFERNPYYWKVDEEGSQLPYMDEVRFDVTSDIETMFAHAISGDYEFHSRHFNDNAHRADAVDNEASGGYTVVELESTYSSDMNIAFNMNHRDAALRKIFQDRQFRIALSHAIDRQELIDVLWNRVGVPSQPAPRPESRFYDEEFAAQYLEFDPDRANQILDDAGYTAGSGGIRQAPDGTPLEFTVAVADDALLGTIWIDAMDMIKDMWAAVGVELHINGQPRENWQNLVNEFDYDLTVWTGDGGYIDETTSVYWYMAAGPGGGAFFARQWSELRTNGSTTEELVEEPPAHITEQWDLYDQFLSEPDPDTRDEIFKQILAIAKEQFYAIGTVQGQGAWAVVADRLKNVGGSMPENPTYGTPGPAAPEQWYITEDK
ncbi:ABC transporter substrate-binding protein [Glycomyces sp. TRM65418]|uniref:ABC transporter substrate-binding protein n=1 Tax=Glycomyces sp. TRM65418 TaxID=2867006 RepID=UPI001CE5CCCF|nr:ABC transporter substrate-binding protein [Glycomyces sp. TRM65418]MCC3765422.1 ABC transporter substrate-binding protein [Glycomyces sp. TRM65418]QZD55032.1 ABC transporter substrate-binding protein [Glycomyces sp. TRM65418]